MELWRRLRISYSSIAFLILTCSACLCGAAPLSSHPAASSQLLPRQEPKTKCGFEGMSEVYGLGVRLGVYLQWISAFLANQFLADSVRDLLTTNTIFLLALFTTLAFQSARNIIQTAEAVILSQLCFGFLATVSTTWGLRVRLWQETPSKYGYPIVFPLLGSTVRLCLACAISLYNIWFWFVGVEKFSNRTPGCPTVGFLFAPVDVLGRVRIFFKITAVIVALFYSFAALSEMIHFVWSWVCYSVFALIFTFIINIHRKLHDKSCHQPGEKEPTLFGQALKYSLIYLFGIPSVIMLSRDIDIEITRLQSWSMIGLILRLPYFVYSSILDSILLFSTRMLINITVSSSSSPKEAKSTLSDKQVEEAEGNEEKTATTDDQEDTIAPPPISQPKVHNEDGRPKTDRRSGGPIAQTIFSKIKSRWKKDEKFDISKHIRLGPALNCLPILNLVALILSIVAIELVIKWNNITNVNTIDSVSQLIPFIIGIMGFFKLVILDIIVSKSRTIVFNILLKSLMQFDPLPPREGEPTSDPKSPDIVKENDVSNIDSQAHNQFHNSLNSINEQAKSDTEGNRPPELPPASFLGFAKLAQKQVPMLQKSIGEQILEMLAEDSGAPDLPTDSSIKETNAWLAWRIFKHVQDEGMECSGMSEQKADAERKRICEIASRKLRFIDINPLVLVIRLTKLHIGQWWEFLTELEAK